MKKLFLFCAAVIASVGLLASDIPTGYYDAIEGTQDSVLKSTLYSIIKGGERYFYGPNQYHSTDDPDGRWHKGDLKGYGTWYAFPLTDMHPDGIVWDMYSNSVRYYPKDRGESGCSLNIEHCLPKSWWGTGAATDTIYRDLFNLNPSDAQANSNKSNYAPGHVVKADKFDNGSFRMDSKKSQYGYICYEPAPEYRGDFARTYFYMVTAYEQQTWSDTYSAYVNNDSYLRFTPTIIQVLLDWHRADSVDAKEICRADQISTIQSNRNPFIDYPDLIEYIWGNKKGQAVSLTSLTCAFVSDACPEPIVPTPELVQYDTLINLPGLTKAIVNEYTNDSITAFASEKNGSNGTRAITMGASTTDGYLQFFGLNLQDTATLVFRASPYNTADSMQIDIYADTTLVRTIKEIVVQNTRNEVQYRTLIPAGTDSIKVISVGANTKIRACMQELYLLQIKPEDPTIGITVPTPQPKAATKEIHNGQVLIRRNTSIFTTLGQLIQ